jgi:hypothetical protein
MNRKLLALAVTAALAAPLAAQAAPTVYGQLNLSLDMVDLDNGCRISSGQLQCFPLGVKGEEALSNGYRQCIQSRDGRTWNALLLDVLRRVWFLQQWPDLCCLPVIAIWA